MEIAVETPRQIRRRVEEGRAHDTIPVPLGLISVQLTERKFHRALRRYDDVLVELCEAEAERLRARHATTRKRR